MSESMNLHPLSAVWNALRGGWMGLSIGGMVVGVFVILNLVSVTPLLFLLPVGFVIGIGYGIAYYVLFEYQLTEDTFDVTSGVFNRKHREIPFRRIQNIDTSQSFIQRLLGLSVVKLETAGGGQTEAELNFVSREEASRLQSIIRKRKRSSPAEEDATAESMDETADSDSTLLFKFQPTELVILSVALLRPGAALVLLGIPFAEDLAVTILLTLARPFGGPAELSLTGLSSDEIFALAIVALPLIALVTWVVSAVYTAIAYFDFELERIDSNLVYERGLLSRYSGTIPLEKVQTLSITEPVLARPLGYAGLTVETAGYSPSQSQSNDSETAIPLTRRERTLELARSIEPFDDQNLELTFTRSPKQARRRYAVRYLSVVVVLVIIGYAISIVYNGFSYWYTPVVLLPLVPIAAHYKWKHRGYHVGENHIALRDGFWRRTTRIVSYYRLQTVLTQQTVFQRRLDIADLTADTASSATLLSGEATAYDIATEDAKQLHERLREQLQREVQTRSE
jgi:putative membrane protein